MREKLQIKLERVKRLYLLGDLAEHDYLAECTQIQNSLSVIRRTKLPNLESATQALRNFGHH